MEQQIPFEDESAEDELAFDRNDRVGFQRGRRGMGGPGGGEGGGAK